jgi:imidazole glycerol-phosphate synthase subunit HisH
LIAVLDYGIGNLRSAEKALQHVGADARLVASPDEATGASGIVLPGVGAFGACVDALARSGLGEVLVDAVEQGDVPVLGICVGFQMLFQGSEESPSAAGLGLIPGTVRLLGGSLKRPQMQWNRLDPVPGVASAMLAPFAEPPWVYFVHSYAAVPDLSGDAGVVATCDYGGPVVAAVERGQLWGCQFHPEKSSNAGLAILAEFARRCA